MDLLFAFRARSISRAYINNTIIPTLCDKAAVPTADVRGNITSHRARSTIASQLYNAKEPMTVFELQAWLGHRSPQWTQFYAKLTPATLTKAYRDVGYFERNVLYTPKDSSRAQLVEVKDHLQKMRATIPLTDDEEAAVDDGEQALDRLLDTSTPAGQTPRQLETRTSRKSLPIIDVR